MNKRIRINKRSQYKSFEVKFYESLLVERPEFVEVLMSLGDIYTKKGFYREGLAVDRKLASLRPEDPIIHYNLACSLSLSGEVREAMKELKKAVLLGYDEFDYILSDKDLDNLRKSPTFEVFFQKLGKMKKK